MNAIFLKSIEKRAIYHRSPETKVSFYRQPGSTELLPQRINFSIDPEGFQPVTRTGRAAHLKKVADVKARFTRKDTQSPYYVLASNTEPRISFSVWEYPEMPLLLGFADIGRSNEMGKIEQTPDLVAIIRTPDNCRDTLELRIYPGLYPKRDTVLTLLHEELRVQPPIWV